MNFGNTVILSLFSLLSACQDSQKTVDHSIDFTPPGEFTKGVEGPAVDRENNIYAVNFAQEGTIGKVTLNGESSLFVELPEGSTGNGIRLNQAEALLVADYTGHNVLQIDLFLKKVSVYAHSDSMNQPNDLAIRSDDMLFASDPNWSASTGNIWRIDTSGQVTLLEGNMGTTNGIEVSFDEKQLYVNESVQRNVWVYDLLPDGSVQNKRLLIQFPDFGMDGMRCDNQGNLYITRHGKGTVAVVSPKGEIIREIELTGKKPTNITFGGKDGKTCYVTIADRGNLETFQAEFPGRAWVMKQ